MGQFSILDYMVDFSWDQLVGINIQKNPMEVIFLHLEGAMLPLAWDL